MPRRSLALLDFVLLSAIWGASFLFIKLADRGFAPLQVSLVRIGSAALCLLLMSAIRGVPLPRDRRVWLHVTVVGIFLNAVPFALFPYAEHHVSSVLAGIWNAATPLFAAIFGFALIPHDRPTRGRVLGLAVGFAGVLVVLAPWRSLPHGALLGTLACIGAAVCYGIGVPYMSRFMSHTGVDPLALITAQLTSATAILIMVTAIFEPHWHAPGITPVLSVLELGLIGTAIAFLMNFRLMATLGPILSSMVTYLMPVVSTILGVAALGEHLHWNEPAGAVVVIGGIMLSRRRSAARAIASPAKRPLEDRRLGR